MRQKRQGSLSQLGSESGRGMCDVFAACKAAVWFANENDADESSVIYVHILWKTSVKFFIPELILTNEEIMNSV